MVNLVIDIGNTFSKIALFNNRALTEMKITGQITAQEVTAFLAGRQIDHVIVSSVGHDIGELERYLQQHYRYLRFSAATEAGVVNRYQTPGTLGLDRYAAVIGARALFPGHNCLVIDAGTCVTYDFIDRDANYDGGIISPGVGMRFKAMHAFTGRLPLVEPDFEFNEDFGKDTRSALLAGVMKGIVFEVTGFIHSYYNKNPGLHILLCGGDVNFFDRQLKNSIFARNIKAEPNLVLIGLNEVIHQYNE